MYLIELIINSSVAFVSGKLPFEVIYRCPVKLTIGLALGQNNKINVYNSLVENGRIKSNQFKRF